MLANNAVFPIEMIDGVASIQVGDKVMPLLFGGGTIHHQGPHWYFKEAIKVLLDFFLVELVSSSGGSAAHIYDESMTFISNRFEDLQEDISKSFRNVYAPVFRELWQGMVCGKTALEPATLQILEALGKGSRIELGRFVRDSVLASDQIAILNSDLPIPLVLDCEAIQTLFKTDLLASQTDAMLQGDFALPSPFGMHSNVARKGLLFKQNDYYQFYAYYFQDSVSRTSYYVVCGDWNYRILALFFPDLGYTLFPSEENKRFFDVSAHQTVRDAIYEHVINYCDDLSDYLFADRCEPIIRIGYWHLGHHLWNELTGLQHTVDSISAKSLPPILVVSPDTSEMYEKVEALFPQLVGKVNRSLRSAEQLPLYLYKNNYLMFHPTHNYISQKLADRILMRCAEACAPKFAAQILALRQSGYRIVMIGLRVENRTLTDLAAFCSNVIEALKSQLERVVVVIDGHNRSTHNNNSNKEFRSLHDHISLRRPIDVEHSIYETLKMSFAHDDNIQIVSTIGEPISSSVFWCHHAEFYVTPWGAGLAKYKWVCNKPGLIVSNQFFLGIGESYLYDKGDYRECPERTFRVSQQDVQDFPDADLVIPDRDPLRANFEVDLQSVRRELRNLVSYVNGC